MKKTILILIFSAIFLIVGCKRESTTDIEKNNITVLSTTKTWDKISLYVFGPPLWRLDTLEVGLKTRWRDGNLYFIFTIGMNPNRINFIIRLLDSDGFVIIEKKININDMDVIVNERGKYMGMKINFMIPCTAETYLSIKDWSCGWQLF